MPDGRRPRIHLAICGLSLVPRQGVLAPTLADRLDRAMSRIGDLAPGAGTCRIEGDIVQAADADTAFRFWAAPSRPKHFETRRRTRDEPDAICHLVDARPLRRALPEKRR